MKIKHFPDFSYKEAPAGKLILHSARIYLERIHQRLESYGIQKTYGPILKEISMNEGITQKELAGFMQITAPSMSVNIRKMEMVQLIKKEIDGTDLRQIRLYLTEKGKQTARKADREIALEGEKFVENLSPNEQKELKRLLIKILETQEKRNNKE